MTVAPAQPIAQGSTPRATPAASPNRIVPAICLLALGLRRTLARRHGHAVPERTEPPVEMNWMRKNSLPMVTKPGGDAVLIAQLTRASQGSAAGALTPTAPSHSTLGVP